ncbi:Gfo/Idh/MocA family oxidoreductase [Chloroflexi bacterium TSY]|nr:Gfo/Idh/MocA family oxidoreductase [Chloroflexi bacterium TSY]
MTAIGIGILGTGYMALNAYLPAFRRQGATVQALWGRKERRIQEFARQHNIPNAYTDEQALIDDQTVDAVVIATPNALHYRTLHAAAAAGKAVVCEKPLGLNLTQAKEMYTVATTANIVHAVPFLWRLPAHAQEIDRLVKSDFLGQIFDYQAVFSVGAWASAESSLGWRGQAELAGAGVLADFGGHLVDLAWCYVGEIDRVVGQGKTHFPVRQSPEGTTEQVTVFDTCNVLLQFKNGAQGGLHMSYVDLAHNLLLRVEMHGSLGAILYELYMDGDLLTTRLGLRTHDDNERIWETKTEPFADIVDSFCAGVLKGIQSGAVTDVPTLADGVRGQAIIEAITTSIATGRWESVEQ